MAMTTGEFWISTPIFPWLVIILAAWVVIVSILFIILNYQFKKLKEKNKLSQSLMQSLIMEGIRGLSKRIDEISSNTENP